MDPLIELYTGILKTLDYLVDDEGYIHYQDVSKDETKTKIKMNNQNMFLVLPSHEALRKLNWKHLVGFHPGSENIYNTQSEIITFLAIAAGIKIYNTVQSLVAAIVDLGLNETQHGKLNMKQKSLLSKFNIDMNVQRLLVKIIKHSTGITGATPLLSIRLDRGGVIQGETYNRTCSIIPHILIEKNTLCGVTPTSKKARDTVIALFREILPEESNQIHGSNNSEMPYLLAFLKLLYNVSVHLNMVIEILGKYSPVLPLSINWYDHIKDLPTLVKQYLPQQMIGNTGRPISKGKPGKVEEQTLVPATTLKPPELTFCTGEFQPYSSPFNQPPAPINTPSMIPTQTEQISQEASLMQRYNAQQRMGMYPSVAPTPQFNNPQFITPQMNNQFIVPTATYNPIQQQIPPYMMPFATVQPPQQLPTFLQQSGSVSTPFGDTIPTFGAKTNTGIR